MNEHVAARSLLTKLLESAGRFIGDGSGRFVIQYCQNFALAKLILFLRSYLHPLWECFANIVNAVICKRVCGCLTTKLLLVCRELSHRSHQKPSSQPSPLNSLSCFSPSDRSQSHQRCRRININRTIVDDSPDNSKMPTGHIRHVASFLCAGCPNVGAMGIQFIWDAIKFPSLGFFYYTVTPNCFNASIISGVNSTVFPGASQSPNLLPRCFMALSKWGQGSPSVNE